MQDQENQAAPNPEEDLASAQPSTPADPAIPSLEVQLSATEAKLAEMHDAFMRAKAEADNIRRRAQEDVAKAHKFAVESFAEAMVPVKDSLEMALKVEAPSVENLKEGVEMTLKQLNAAFEKNRLVEIMPAQGEKLDPNKHQAVAVVPADQEANTVVAVLQKGYMIADRLLRPAIVTAAQPK
ncbi:nucleotide exchange factor GrpE [Massilia endophytica]|uniref:nucleotide exchange factor GrpE n=1 Tax=Massilia endophytica TaxID=2899220 RepID=UPI001E4BD228|nr:nucleotide exchange factor GrpE [Massilia endophytica]UGQ45882.1 nucleotide exchange factor GrpE [Massilia endophytica]